LTRLDGLRTPPVRPATAGLRRRLACRFGSRLTALRTWTCTAQPPDPGPEVSDPGFMSKNRLRPACLSRSAVIPPESCSERNQWSPVPPLQDQAAAGHWQQYQIYIPSGESQEPFSAFCGLSAFPVGWAFQPAGSGGFPAASCIPPHLCPAINPASKPGSPHPKLLSAISFQPSTASRRTPSSILRSPPSFLFPCALKNWE